MGPTGSPVAPSLGAEAGENFPGSEQKVAWDTTAPWEFTNS
ncbi:hypothetical protein GFS31_01950 [Leptolyngbya sp. BL0902]|nr:hypothetical protein GFS31_01950 [Leptolyngbya sp. BL0902]